MLAKIMGVENVLTDLNNEGPSTKPFDDNSPNRLHSARCIGVLTMGWGQLWWRNFWWGSAGDTEEFLIVRTFVVSITLT